MTGFLEAHPYVNILLCEKADRLYITFRNYVTIDELDFSLAFMKEGFYAEQALPAVRKVNSWHQGSDGAEPHRHLL